MINFEYRLVKPPFSESQLQEFLELAGKIFGNTDGIDGWWRMRKMPDVSYLQARNNDVLVGFKIGYAIRPIVITAGWVGLIQLFVDMVSPRS